MNAWQIMAATLVCCSASGCHLKHLRTANEDLERENFQLEQRLDELTWQLEDAKAALSTYQSGSSTPRGPAPLAAPRRRTQPAAQESPASEADAPPRVELPDEESRSSHRGRLPRERVPPFAGPPLISPPSPQTPEGTLPRVSQASSRDGVPVEALTEAESILPRETLPHASADEGMSLAEPQLISREETERAASLVVNPALTVWRRAPSDAASDEGLQVVVEPRTAAGHVVGARGDVAIVVLDPAANGPSARLARWDFPEEQAAQHIKNEKGGAGLHFTLQWPGAVPKSEDLLLFVRLTTPEGEQLVAEFALRPTPATKPAALWTDAQNPNRRLSTSSTASGQSGRWQRGTTPLPPRVDPSPSPSKAQETALRKESEDRPSEKKVEPVAETASPAWAPYR